MVSSSEDSYRHPWLGVEVRHIATLDAIARGGSFREAADQLGYVQSAVSQQIAAFEQVVGAKLLERSPGRGPVALTAAGALVLDHGRRILAELQAARIDLAGVTGDAPASLAVGLAPGVATRLLPRLLPPLAERLPHVRLNFSEPAREDDLLDQVRSGALDAAIGVAPADDRFTGAPVMNDPWVLLAPADSLLAHRGRLSFPAELAGRTFVVPAASRSFAPVAAQLEASGVRLDAAVRAPIGPGMQAVVSASDTVALMPRMAVDESDPATTVVELDPPLAPRRLSLFWNSCRRELTLVDAVHALLLELAQDEAAALAPATAA